MSTPSPAEYETRIHALEKLNATLAAEVDLMQPVITLLCAYRRQTPLPPRLHNAIDIYEAAKKAAGAGANERQ